jgi:hypothetical protein
MSKVVSFKVSNKIYDSLKKQEGTFREILTPLIERYLNLSNNNEYTGVYAFEKQKKYDALTHLLENHERDLQRLIEDFKRDKSFDEFVVLLFEHDALFLHLFQKLFSLLQEQEGTVSIDPMVDDPEETTNSVWEGAD